MESTDRIVICCIVLVLGLVQTFAQEGHAKVTILNKEHVERKNGSNWVNVENGTSLRNGTKIRKSCVGRHEMYRDTYLNSKYTYSTNKNGHWKPRIASCKEKRCDVPVIDNGTPTLSDGSTARRKVEHGVVVTTDCDAKFELDPTSKANNTCSYGQLQLKNCVEKHCGPPDALKNAKLLGDPDRTTWQHGDNVTYTCSKEGMITYSYNNRRTCNYGKWTDVDFECEWKTCGHLDHPSHGRRLKFNNEPTGITEFECDEGYTMRGKGNLMCMVGGRWRPENPPTCHPVICPEPEEINHGNMFQEATDGIFNDFGSVVTYTCDKHYEPEGQMRRRCQANGQWEGKSPACIRSASCPKIQLENGKVEYHENPPNHFYVTIVCDKYADLDPKDSSYLVCLDDKTWSKSPPHCNRQTKVFILDKEYIEERSWSGWGWSWLRVKNGTSLGHGTKIRQSCRGRYELYKDGYLDTNYTESTSMNGHWEPPLATCKKKRCHVSTIDNGTPKLSDGSRAEGRNVEHGVRVTTVCEDKFELDLKHNNNAISECGLKQLGQLRLKTCSPKRCDVPEKRDNTVYKSRKRTLHGGKIKHGATLSVTCRNKTEYELVLEKRIGTKSYMKTFNAKCQYGGYLPPDIPHCEERRCDVSHLKDEAYKNREPDMNSYVTSGGSISVECAHGYHFKSNSKQQRPVTVTCNKGQLDVSVLCEPEPCQVPQIKNSGFSVKEIKHGKQMPVRCNPGYEFQDGSERIYLECKLGDLESDPDIPLECFEKKCRVDQIGRMNGMVVSDTDQKILSVDAMVNSRAVVYLECSKGYESLTDDNRTLACNLGEWKGTVDCLERGCDIPDIQNAEEIGDYYPDYDGGIGHGKQNAEEIEDYYTYYDGGIGHGIQNAEEVEDYYQDNDVGRRHGEQIDIYCKEGYELSHKSNRTTVTCEFGNWINLPSGCFAKKCRVDQIGRMSVMVVSDTDQKILSVDAEVNSGAVVYPECSKGYESLTDDTRTLACNLGEWNGTVDCLERGCDIPVIQNAEEIDGGIKHREQIDIICKEGYELLVHESDRTTVTCEFGNWINLPSGCFAKKCSVNQVGDMSVMNVSGTDGTSLPDGAVVDSGDKVHPKCIKGYMPLNNNTVTPACYLGNWSGSFACLERTCSSPTIRNATLYLWPKLSELNSEDAFVNGQKILVICHDRFVIANSQSKDYIKQLTCVDGEWDSEVSCKAKSCLLTTTEGTHYSVHKESGRIEAVKEDTTVDHGDKISVRCNDKFKLVQGGNDVISRKPKKEKKESRKPKKKKKESKHFLNCYYGTLKGGFACKKKGCHANKVANGEILLNGKSLDNSFIDERAQIEVKCNRGFEIVYKHSTVLFGFTTTCHKESLRKSLPTCRRKKSVEDIECRYPPTDNYIFLFEDYTKVENAAYAPHSSIRYAACSIRDQETGSGSPQRTTCKNGSWEPKLPPCDSNDVDKATEAGREEQDKSCILPEDNRYKFDDGSRTPGEKVEHRSRTKIECVDEKSFSYIDYYYYSDDSDNSHYTNNDDMYIMCQDGDFINFNEHLLNCNDVLSKECANFTNGKVKQSDDFDGFMVTCDEGYSLNISKLQNKFRCDNDVLVNKIYNITASCLPDGCLLPDQLRLQVEKLNKDKSRTGTDLSGGMTVQHGKHVLLNCMTEGYEPKLRTFQCETGKWVSADADWKGANPNPDNERGNETIGLFPECRKAICEPPCKNFGSCIRDNKCKCPRETQGDQCEKFKCPDCERNGGSCPVSTACVCPDNKEGNLCQNFKCDEKCKSNGGTCPFSTACVCPDNKDGTFCQSFKCPECKRNGGTCPVSTACVCPANKYGLYCQHPGCLGSDAKIPSVKRNKLYKQGEVIRDLRCGRGQRLVGNDSSLVCRGGIWQGNVSCEKITKNRYRIRVVTGYSGTDGDVFLKLSGEHGESGEVKLTDDLDHKWNKFERGDTNVFSELFTDVGQIRSISVRHDPYPGRYWSLATVVIYDHARKQYYPFFWNELVYDREEKIRQITIYPNRADPDCQNRDTDCSRYPKQTRCRDNWMKKNCAKYCGYCKDGRLCGDTFTEAFRMRVPKMSPNTTARDIVGCRLKCAEIEACAAAVFRPRSKECFWLSVEQLMSTVDTTQDDPHFEYVYARKLCH